MITQGKAKLIGHEIIPVTDLLDWARWFETADRRVAHTILSRRKRIGVSTVFLGMDHSFTPGYPLWFETLIVGSSLDGDIIRYPDWKSAVRGHAEAVRRARQARWIKRTGFYRRRSRRVVRRAVRRMKAMNALARIGS